MKKHFIFLLLLVGCSYKEDSILGPVDLSEPVLKEIHESKTIQRLKGIDQAGTPHYYCNTPALSRYDHSMGVLYLVQHYGGDKKEQIAALTHDASHTVFSHVADILFKTEGYQDKIHEQSLEKLGTGAILSKYGLSLHDVNPEQETFKRQEQPLPDMCADRIEYNLHTGLSFGLITQKEVESILKSLHFKDDKWFFDNAEKAEEFARLSLYFTENFWGSKENIIVYLLTAKMLTHALTLKLFTLEEFHFLTDKDILDRVNKSQDKKIQSYIKRIKKVHMEKIGHFYIEHEENINNKKMLIKPKFRGINPLVFVDNSCKRLTEISGSFKTEYERIQSKMKRGFYVVLPE